MICLFIFLVSLTLALSQWEREEKSEAMFQGEGSQMLGLTKKTAFLKN
jgi:hypothetical protein